VQQPECSLGCAAEALGSFTHLALVARLARLLDRAAELERQENEYSTE
jgi:hypothetical protein